MHNTSRVPVFCFHYYFPYFSRAKFVEVLWESLAKNWYDVDNNKPLCLSVLFQMIMCQKLWLKILKLLSKIIHFQFILLVFQWKIQNWSFLLYLATSLVIFYCLVTDLDFSVLHFLQLTILLYLLNLAFLLLYL